jgi:serine protease Do
VPSNLAGSIVAQLKDGGKVERGWLGVSMQPMTESLAKAVGRKSADGVLVNEVMTDGPAAKAGLKQGDVVVAINGKTIRDPRDLATLVAGLKAGDNAKFGIWRDGRERNLTVAIGTQPSDQTAALNDAAGEDGKVGLSLAPLTPELRNRFGLEAGAKGAVVAEVASDSKAEESGVQPGDLIVGVAGKAVVNPGQAVDAIKSAQREKKEAVTLLVMRDGATYYLALHLA